MNTQTAQVDELRLVALPSALNCAEMFVQFSLTEWSLQEIRDDAVAVMRALVRAVIANAVESTPGFLLVRLRISGDTLTVEVEGDDATHAQGARPELNGRKGGVVPLNGGTLVWCEVPLPGGMSGSSVRLPRRQRRSLNDELNEQFGQEEPAELDPAALERVLEGLKRHR